MSRVIAADEIQTRDDRRRLAKAPTHGDIVRSPVVGRRWSAVLRSSLFGLAVFVLALAPRLLALDLFPTSDEDSWMSRTGGFAYGLTIGQLGRTYQNGHPGVTTMWTALLSQGSDGAVRFADRVRGERLVAQVQGYLGGLTRARIGFVVLAAVGAAVTTLLLWRLFGFVPAALAGVGLALEPFLVANGQLVHVDGPLVTFMTVSALAALVRWHAGAGRGYVVLSGVAAGLALLSKTPAVFLLAFVPLVALGSQLLLGREALTPRSSDFPDHRSSHVRDGRRASTGSRTSSGSSVILSAAKDLLMVRGSFTALRMTIGGRLPPEWTRHHRGFASPALDLALWALLASATVVALWPAVWVLGPIEVLARIVAFTRETGGQPDEVGSFFFGQVGADPGPFYYPVATIFRLSPFVVGGALALLILVRGLDRAERARVGWLLVIMIGFAVMMTLGPKKFDRYLLPIFPIAVALAALGWWLLLRRARRSGVRIALGGGLVALAAWPLVSVYPYPLSYYSPLLGGGAAAARTVMVGNGEGLDQAARWIAAQPEAENLRVAAHSFDILAAMIPGDGEPLREGVPSDADYIVTYGRRIQMQRWGRSLERHFQANPPVHTVRINGIEYARIHPGPRRNRQP